MPISNSTLTGVIASRIAEEALRAEVVRNYKAFMHATEEIRSMENGIQTLKDLLGSTSTTLQVGADGGEGVGGAAVATSRNSFCVRVRLFVIFFIWR